MNIRLDNNNSKLILVSLFVFSIFIGLSCVSAADVHNDTNITDNSVNGTFHTHFIEQNASEIDGGYIIIDLTEQNDSFGNPFNFDIVDDYFNNDDSIKSIDHIINNSRKVNCVDENGNICIPVKYGMGSYHWEVSEESYGVDVLPTQYVPKYPADSGMCGSGGTAYFNFHVNSDDYYVKLILVNFNGDIIDTIDFTG